VVVFGYDALLSVSRMTNEHEGLYDMTSSLSMERLQRLDRHFSDKYIDEGKLAGVLTLVARRGEIAHFSALGKMDLERDKPVEEDSIFRIYSMGKPITSVALMMLYEQGNFRLSDPVSAYLPEWADAEVWVSGESPDFVTSAPARAITIRDLLSHQSGLTYGFFSDNPIESLYPSMNTPAGIDETLSSFSKLMARVPLRYEPGTAWNYSISTDICGYLVEVISGHKFDDYLRQQIFDRLKMPDTGFHVTEDKIDRFAACYMTADSGLVLQDDPAAGNYSKPPKLLSGGGGMVSTAPDYYRFTQMLLNGGILDGERIISRKTLDLMTSNHLPGKKTISERLLPGIINFVPEGYGFGLGFGVMQDPTVAQTTGSTGQYLWGGAASTYFWVDPVEELTVVFMTQLLGGPATLRLELHALVNAAIDD
jgi:CubicO group peptidase (beta-lactamase class C family)